MKPCWLSFQAPKFGLTEMFLQLGYQEVNAQLGLISFRGPSQVDPQLDRRPIINHDVGCKRLPT